MERRKSVQVKIRIYQHKRGLSLAKREFQRRKRWRCMFKRKLSQSKRI